MTKLIRTLATSLTVILVVALCLRVNYAWDYQKERPHQALAVLPFLFEPGNIAFSIATGKGFSSPFREDTGPTAWLTPVYPLLLAGIFRIFGVSTFSSFVAAAGLNILLSTLTAVPIYFVGRRIGGLSVAALAAWLWAVFPNAIKLPVQSMWDVSLATLLAALILWATLALADSRRAWQWCAYGLLWGLALMTNAALIVVLPLLLGWLAWRSRRLDRPLLAAGMAALCCVPWTIRNLTVFHSFIPLRTVTGLTLWLGNHDLSSGVGRLHPIDNSEERARYVELGEIAYMQEKKREALHFMVEHPASEASACWYRFVALWAGGSPHPLTDFMDSPSWSFRGILLFNLLTGVAAFAGIVFLSAPAAFMLSPWPSFPWYFQWHITLPWPRPAIAIPWTLWSYY